MREDSEMKADLSKQIEELSQVNEEIRTVNELHTKAMDGFYSNLTDYLLFWAQIAMNARESYDHAYKDMVLENIAKSFYDTAQDLKQNVPSEKSELQEQVHGLISRNKVFHNSSL